MKRKSMIQQVETFVVNKRRHHPHNIFKSKPDAPMYLVTFEILDGAPSDAKHNPPLLGYEAPSDAKHNLPLLGYGSQLELQVPYDYFTFFIEGDEGILYYQDRNFLSFERTKRL